MDLISFLWGGIAAIYILLAWIHLLIYGLYRGERSQLFFVMGAAFAVLMAWVELRAMKTSLSISQIKTLLLIGHFALSGIIVSIILFLHYYLKSGRRWLVLLAVSARLLTYVIALIVPEPYNYQNIELIVPTPFLDGQFSVPIGAKSWRTLVGTFSCLMFLWASIDVTYEIWRRRGFQKGMIVSFSNCIFSILILNSNLFGVVGYFGTSPANFFTLPLFSVYFLGVALAMSFEISREMIQASRLTRKLEEKERSFSLAVKAAGLDVWFYDYLNGQFWLSPFVRQLLRFPPDSTITLEMLLERVEESDRNTLREAIARVADTSDSLSVEYRVRYEDDTLHWINSIGEVDFGKDGRPLVLRGVSLDITQRKLAEDAARNLSGMLINAQEEERTRLARELHDDLGQRIAHHAIELGLIGDKPPSDPEQFRSRIDAISEQVAIISSNLSTLSHTLHPANLKRLGLVPAMRGLCRDISSAHEIAIDFRTLDSRLFGLTIPDDTALCLYRITQEALRNVIRHSQATQVTVDMSIVDNRIDLLIIDDGVGFNRVEVAWKRSLGLTSMQERTRLVGGAFSIQTGNGEGTTIHVSVPVSGSRSISERD